uniref:Lon proteolytic domain-containing protein n=1 Tax=viral metagenome TaxID=1070528 RepID=A0A6C0AY15_9ZZZZ|tara:strand:+ start:4912 stop:8175 length:3264 start_codon:yes stop_codon:yes gene_type:complete
MKNVIVKSQVNTIFEKKIANLKKLIHKTILSCQKYKVLDILSQNDLNICLTTLESIYQQINIILNKVNNNTSNIEIEKDLTNLISELTLIIKNFGTDSLSDLISLVISEEYNEEYFFKSNLIDKFNIIENCVHPINFKYINWKNETVNNDSTKKVLQKNRIIEDYMISENSENLDCFDIARTSKSFQTKVYGMKVSIHDYKNKKTYIIACIVDDVLLSCINSVYIENKLESLNNEKPSDNDFDSESWQTFMSSLTLKELLVYNNSELYTKYQGIINQVQLIKQKTISQVVKEFLNSELYGQRTMLTQLLIKTKQPEFQYLAYLLYDLLSNENNGNVDTQEQTLLYDSLPWNIKKNFRDAMRQTIQYTNNLYNYDNNKIPLEQQICLLKADDNVKEKAILKLKEVKAKSEDSGSKAKQYLDGLLKIPFRVIKEEYILTVINETQICFKNMCSKLQSNTINKFNQIIIHKERYTNIELLNYINNISENYIKETISASTNKLINNINMLKKEAIISINNYINYLIKINNLNYKKLIYSGKKISEVQNNISKFIITYSNNDNIINSLYSNFSNILGTDNHVEYIKSLNDDVALINKNICQVTKYIEDVNTTLNNAVYGHEKAKRQIERIIGQWINGEKSGYCFGFEGPPGCGKTTLAKKGIAHCLKDYQGDVRPFSFIAVGGSSNGSTLEGHNYTYVGSTWGRIVDILIETKCMNPIIFIDELDKISRTEHGKEIIGILTHLIDPTQNDSFQDKYFSGIDLDLSKALFIFSYNDVECIDRILLDRIHRIKFKHLSLSEKLIITNNYILPEIYNKMGFDNIITMDNTIIDYIITTYTNEPGVRKLKEILFEIIGEINLTLLTTKNNNYTFPINITIDDLKYKYLKDRIKNRIQKINSEHCIGVINGLWANSVGQGGLLPIEVKFNPASNFLDLKLTGMQGDVMKESMNVAKTLAWSLLDTEIQARHLESFDKIKNYGLHIHVPEGSTPKDGPSAGAAITTVLYSLLAHKKINKNIAITGEICLQGKITAIGGLDLKILGGLKSGATEFIYPKENDKDFNDFYQDLKDKTILDNIKFHSVENISEVLQLIFVD